MTVHPLPEGTRVILKTYSRWFVYRVLEVKPMERGHGKWYYTLCADEYWESKGVYYVQGGPDVLERFAGAAQYDTDIDLWYDQPRKPTAEEIYDMLRKQDGRSKAQ